MDRPTTPEEIAAQSQAHRAVEKDLLKGLLAFADSRDDITTIVIKRGPAIELSFRIHALSEREYKECDERATHYAVNKAFGNIRMPDKPRDEVKYRDLLIYTATEPEDRAAIWDNRTLWAKYDVPAGYQVIDKLLRAGEKNRVIAKLDEISGYGGSEDETDAALEETTGN